ncbi:MULTISPECIES: TRAP transporter substrate-binding protein [Cupriavidus]|uniref:ABC transporter substrate-binding protein n=1 Tax=Cupriavidus pauculus TaxID=82633 RepID=A0A3G8GYA7_9BURK|nr:MULTISPECIES: TRAP transporter substrate-binding protein [Cupriavidus]AZG12985.1 ABC transporter substrate-binding protein [Cupriavidus pauculus]MDT6962230.1 TRAP transporter substrate-binding protein [Cupriavidus sp. SZY C1]
MERRSFLLKASAVAATGALAACGKEDKPAAPAASASAPAAPAVVGSNPAVEWRLASSFPKSLDTIYGGAETLSQRVKELTDGKFNIKVFAAGEIVPGLQVLDAVQNQTVQIGHTAGYYYFGKNPTLCFDTTIPFGLTARQQNAWMLQGNGMKLMREFFKEYNVVNFMGGNTCAQMGGWFRKEIKTVADLQGLKYRVAGFAGVVLSRLGVVPQQIAGGDIYPALEKGTIDAAEWVGPYDDEKLGFYKVAPYYYYPGWWEGSAQLSFYASQPEFDKLPALYKRALETATIEAHTNMMAKYDTVNPQALARLLENGVKLRPFSKEIMEACFKATQDAYAEESGKNASFKKIYDDWRVFRNNEAAWFNVAEQAFSQFSFARKL